MAEIAFVLAPGQNAFFRELAEALRAELERLGVAATIAEGDFPKPRKGLVYVLLPPHEYAELRRGDLPAELLGRTIFVCAEQPGSPWFGSNLGLTRLGGAVFDVNPASVRRLRELGIEAEHLRLGYTPLWDRFDPGADRSVDVLFLGRASRRREQLLASWAPALWRRRSRLVLSDNLSPNPATSESFVAGEEKRRLLADSKLLLNVHGDEEPYFEWLRVLEAIHCGAVVVSEWSTDYAPLVAGEHFLSGRPESLAAIAEGLLADEPRRRAMRAAAYELIRERLPMSAAAERLAEAAERLDRRPRRRTLRSLLGLRPPAGPEPTLGTVLRPVIDRVQEPSNQSLRALKESQLAMIEVSRRLERLEHSSASGGARPAVEIEARTPAWDGAQPRVSVVTALYNHAEHVGAALDSVARGRFRDFEMIVVDDGSTDASLQAVRDWMAVNPDVPALLLRHPFNRGLPSSRNTAIAFARGEHVLVLDSDNEVYPHCLERLVAALDDDPGSAFAYGILETFDENGPRGLIGFLGWDPERLRRHNYIDALALTRRSVLREVDGFTTDLRLYGWEDYDLWCKLAARGMRGAHVKEIVGRYRTSGGSMISLTNVSLEGAEATLRERHPAFFAG
jgi:Glycosyl transferase family 2/Glycosyl transferases group 1